MPFWVLWARFDTFLEVLGVSRAPFLGIWGCLGLHFGCSGGPMGGIGGSWSPLGRPKAPKVKFTQFVPSHLGVMFVPFWKYKTLENQVQCLMDLLVVFLWFWGGFWDQF